MKTISLSTRLGLMVSLMGACLVLLLATLAFLVLDHELDTMARKSLENKMELIEHSLTMNLNTREIASHNHPLPDLVMGHDNFYLTIIGPSPNAEVLLSIGTQVQEPLITDFTASETLDYLTWTDGRGNQQLGASRLIRLRSGENVRVLLTRDRTVDQALLNADLRSTLLVLPLLLVMIGLGAWWLAQRGLAPLKQFSNVAAKVTTQDLTHRLAVDNLPKELAELAQAFNVMLDRLDAGVQQLSQFSDDLAHELRAPLTNLMGKTQVTLSRPRAPDAYKAALESNTEELERLARIVYDMLFLAQVGHPSARASFTTVSLAQEAERVMELFALSAEDKHLNLTLSGNAQVQGDRLMIQRALSNLLSNAIRHSPEGGYIPLRVEAGANTICVSISNAGAGIEAHHLPHVFERFYRADSSRARTEGGTGLGLAIVQSIMALHQGLADVHSRPSGFTQFRLVFPRPCGAPTDTGPATPTRSATSRK
ncbi:heavy metal sensor histidine kinase [Pseudomonas trivialis]|uniref:heavy metal sensor histidine kinase n=1 Tax=Pseudomonas trivialis TaxID=200450 RepID=UPI0030D36733